MEIDRFSIFFCGEQKIYDYLDTAKHDRFHRVDTREAVAIPSSPYARCERDGQREKMPMMMIISN